MYYCSNYVLAVLLCVVTMFCWGSWGNTQKLAGKRWRYELFYWDYVIGLVLFALATGFTMGSSGANAGWGFAANLKASCGAKWIWPFLGGIVFNASNILLSAAIAVAGMSVAFPVGVGLALVGGTVANWFVDGKGDPALIWTGLALIVASIICNALAFKAKERVSEKGEGEGGKVKKGLVLAIFAGLLMSWFSPLVNRVVDMSFMQGSPMPSAGLMTPYTAFFVFTLGVFASNFIFNTIAMKRPVAGDPVKGSDWFKGGFPIHLVGILGGSIWALGTLLSFVTAGTAGAAISYALGQGATLVSALWGILVWKEFAGAPRKSSVLNAAMLVLFVAGLALLVKAGSSTGEEKAPVKVIFDTDMYTDFDDVGALACLHALADAGECEIIAVGCNTWGEGNRSVAACEVINAYYGRKQIPVGCARSGGRSGAGERGYGLPEKYPQWVRHLVAADAPLAVDVYRTALKAAADKSVVLCSVGFLNNVADLLKTDRDLVSRKVKCWVCMACKYPDGREYNSMHDPASSAYAFENWPKDIPVVWTDFDYGRTCYAGRAVAEKADAVNPVKDAFARGLMPRDKVVAGESWDQLSGHPSWDETAVLIAVRGWEEYFNLERGFYRMTGNDGTNAWHTDPNFNGGRVTEKVSKAEVGRVIDELMCRRPAVGGGWVDVGD